MPIIEAYPPNIARIRECLPASREQVFAHYPDIYNPSGKDLDPDLLLHEEIHLAQQKEKGTESWWFDYLTRPDFRYEAELSAFAAQYAFGLRSYRRKVSDQMLTDFALNLSGVLYATGKSYQECEQAIRRRAKEYLMAHQSGI